MAKVGVIIPAYNSEKTLDYCLKSVIGQTYDDYEIVVVNDGSDDKSLDIMKKYKELSKVKFTIINKPNGGAASARKAGLEKLDTEYVTFVDSDDFLDKDYIENLVNTIEETGTNICCARFVNNLNIPIIKHISAKNRKRTEVIDLEKDEKYLPIMYVVTTGKLYKREFIGITDKNFLANEDLSINYYYYAMARNISYNNDTNYHYVPYSTSLVRTKIEGYEWNIIKNTLLPLTELKRKFDKSHLLFKYHKEIEQLFIKNIFQRMDNVSRLVKDPVKRDELNSTLLDYLTFHFPNWRDNEYLANNFQDFESWDIASAKRNKKRIITYNPTSFYTEESIFNKYKNISKNI